MKMNRISFLSQNKIGLVLRAFATKREQIPDRAAIVGEMLTRALGTVVNEKFLIGRVDVMVWADNKNYPGKVDCGGLAEELQQLRPKDCEYFVHEVHHGDLFCALSNYAVAIQSAAGCSYSLMISSEAAAYWTPSTMEAIVDAACAGAKAVGVAINELTQSVLEGRLANTFCLWRNRDLLTVGGFDLRAANPIDDRRALYLHGWSQEKGEVFYPLQGVEEVIPLARLTELFGHCIAPILPSGSGVQQYRVPDPHAEPELWSRHVSKMGTKLERQTALLASIGKDISFLRGGVMPQYRNF